MEHQIITAWAQVAATVVIGLGQLGMIGWGLRQMGKASEDRNRQMSIDSEDRNRQLDIMAASQSEQAQAFQEESRVRREESRIQAETLGQIGQGITELLRRPA